MPAKTNIFTIPVQVNGMVSFDLYYAHGESVAGQITVALANPKILYHLEMMQEEIDHVEYIPTSYINIITKEENL